MESIVKHLLSAMGVVLFLVAAVGIAGLVPETALTIKLSDDKGTAVDVTGLNVKDLAALSKLGPKTEEWLPILAVYVERAAGKDRKDQPALSGDYRVESEVLRFIPRYPLVRGVKYRAVLDVARLASRAGSTEKPIEVALHLPKKESPATAVEQVYPTADKLPENQLRFYLHFSAPMSKGEAYQHIRLLNADGKAIELPFLELDQELWDTEQKRFTLIIDPGRIKRGLKPREEFGPVLEEGKSFTLVIDRKWSDAEGQALKETYRKPFRVMAPDETLPDPRHWKLKVPASGTRAPLVVNLPKPLDHALLHRMVAVEDAKGKIVEGTIDVTDKETCWRFTPKDAWPLGAYHLVSDTRLEDLAGNNIARPFEVDVFRPVQREVKAEKIKVPFEVKAAERDK